MAKWWKKSDLTIEPDPDQLLDPIGYEVRLQAFRDNRGDARAAHTSPSNARI